VLILKKTFIFSCLFKEDFLRVHHVYVLNFLQRYEPYHFGNSFNLSNGFQKLQWGMMNFFKIMLFQGHEVPSLHYSKWFSIAGFSQETLMSHPADITVFRIIYNTGAPYIRWNESIPPDTFPVFLGKAFLVG